MFDVILEAGAFFDSLLGEFVVVGVFALDESPGKEVFEGVGDGGFIVVGFTHDIHLRYGAVEVDECDGVEVGEADFEVGGASGFDDGAESEHRCGEVVGWLLVDFECRMLDVEFRRG